MKNIKIFLIVIILGVISFIPIKVNAYVSSIYVGDEEININETKNIYGGEVSFKLNEDSKPQLTIKNVNIDEYHDFVGLYIYTGIFYNDEYVLKLEGNNTITSMPSSPASGYSYFAVTSNDKINVIGDGTLNINVSNYDAIYAFRGDSVNVGKDSVSNGPNINADLEGISGTSSVIFMYEIGNVYNSNIKLRAKGYYIMALSNESNGNYVFKNSDINMELDSEAQTYAISFDGGNLLLENVDMLIKGKEGVATTLGISASDLLTIKDSRIVDLIDSDGFSLYSFSGSLGTINFNHTNNKEYLFVANKKMYQLPSVTYTNIDNKMAYVSSTSLDDVVQSNSYNMNNLRNENYFVLTTGINNKIISGDNQNINKNIDTEYSFVTNHFRYLVENIKLDNNLLDSDDYVLDKNGTVSLTSTGFNKLMALDLGTHSINIKYYYGNSLNVNLNITDGTNPKTFDNIFLYVIFGSISFISLIGCGIFIKKNICDYE